MSRQSIVVAVLLLAVGALATAAAHISLSAPKRSDIELLVPAAPKTADRVQPAVPGGAAPLFATNTARSLPADVKTVLEGGAAVLPSAASLAQRESARRTEAVTKYQNYTSSRRRNGSGGGSGGSAAFGGGGFGGGGMGGGVSGTASRRGNSASTPAATRSRSSSASSNRSSTGSTRSRDNTIGDNHPIRPPDIPVVGGVVPPVAVATPGIPGSALGNGPLGNGPSPAAAPEPLTLLLVGSGLVGLYGARKHLVG